MADERNEQTEIGGDGAAEVMELTGREVALAQGLDPDGVDAVMEDIGDDGGSDESDAGEADATDGVETGKDADASSWITDDLKALAGTYGLGDADLADLDSEADFLRVARVMERRKVSSGELPTKTPDTVSGDEPAKADDVPTIDVQKYIDAGYDEETVALARVAASMQQQLGKIVPAFEQQQKSFAEEQHRRTAEEFHRVADELGRYGEHAKLNAKDDAKRKRLWEAAAVVANDLAAGGREPPPLKTILQRAEIVAFGDEIMAERKAELGKRVKDQSSRRRSVGRATTSPGKRVLPGEADDPVAAIMAVPEIKKFLAENSF